VVRLGQNFLVDTNLLDAIVRDAKLEREDVVLEVGAGEGPLTERLAEIATHVHAIELDRRLEPALAKVAALPNVDLHWGDALKLDLAAFEPAPTRVVSNLPYSIATPLILRTIEELPSVERWTIMVQREIAERLRSAPNRREYGIPSVLVQIACDTKTLRTVNRSVFRPPPRVESIVIELRRAAPAADEVTRDLVRTAFAHRRKKLTTSLSEAQPGCLGRARAMMRELGVRLEARPEEVRPGEYVELAHGMPWQMQPRRENRRGMH
jgi:16S rRNA (adenine1518-N6/adenine1519-N6)-dimethyltransferase